MAKLTDFQLLENVIIYMNRIAFYTENFTVTNINKDPKTVDAVMYCIQQMGKNAHQLSEEFIKRHREVSELDWLMPGMFKMDDYFLDEELWDVIKDEERGILVHYNTLETIYLKERQKPENKSIAKIPAKFIKNDEDVKLPLKSKQKEKTKSTTINDRKKGFNPRNHITSHSSIWTVKKR